MQSDTVDMDALEKKNLATPFQQGAERGREFVHCGPALPGHRVEVRDESGNALPARHVGRIFAHGPSLLEGYYGNAEASARVLSPDGRTAERRVGDACVSTSRSWWASSH